MLGGIERRRPLADSYAREPRIAGGPGAVGGLKATDDIGGLGGETMVNWGTSRVVSGDGNSLSGGVDPRGQVAARRQQATPPRTRSIPKAAAAPTPPLAATYITSDRPLIVGAPDGMLADGGVHKEKKKGDRWIVQVDRSANKPLGLDLDADTLVIDGIIPGGLVEAWNKDCPDKAVHAGDRILEVNGQREPAMALDECRRRQMLTITVSRGKRAQPGVGGGAQGKLPAWLAEKSWMPGQNAASKKDRDTRRDRIKDTHRHDHGKMEAKVKDSQIKRVLGVKPGEIDTKFTWPTDDIDAGSIADSDFASSPKAQSPKPEDGLEDLGIFEEDGDDRIALDANTSAGKKPPAANPEEEAFTSWWGDQELGEGGEEPGEDLAMEYQEAEVNEVSAHHDKQDAAAAHLEDDTTAYVEEEAAEPIEEETAEQEPQEEDDGWWPGLDVLGLGFGQVEETPNKKGSQKKSKMDKKELQKQEALERGPLGRRRSKPRWDTSWEAPSYPVSEKPFVEDHAWWAPKAVESLQPPAKAWPGEEEPVHALTSPTPGWDTLLDMSAAWPGEATPSRPPSPKNQQSFSRVRRDEKKVVTAVADPPLAGSGWSWEKPILSPAADKKARGTDRGLNVGQPLFEDPEHRLVRIRIKRTEGELGLRFQVDAWPPALDVIETGSLDAWKERDIHPGDQLIQVDGVETEGCSMSRVQELLGRRPVLLVFKRSILNYMSLARQRLQEGTLQPVEKPSSVESMAQDEAKSIRATTQWASGPLSTGHVSSIAPRDQVQWYPTRPADATSMTEESADPIRQPHLWTFDVGSPRSDVSDSGSVAKRGLRIVVTVVSAKGLWRADRHGLCAIFCSCHFSNKPSIGFQTRVVEGWNPEWNHAHELHDYEEGDNLEFSVWDQNMKGKGLLGKAYMQSIQFYPRGFEGDLKLSDAWQKPRGFLEVKISAWDPGKQTDASPTKASPIKPSSVRVQSPSPPVASFSSARKVEWDLDHDARYAPPPKPAPWDKGHRKGKGKSRADVLAKTGPEVDLDNPPVFDDPPSSWMPVGLSTASASWVKTTNQNLDDAAELLSNAQVMRMERLSRQAERAAHCAERARLEEQGHSSEIQESMRKAETATRKAWRQCEADLQEQATAAIKLADKLRFEELVSAQESEAWKLDPARDEVIEEHAKELAMAEHAVRLEELKTEKQAQLTMYKTQSVMWQAKQAAVVSKVAEMAHEAEVALEQGKADEQLALAQMRNAARIEDNTRMRRTEDAMYLAMNTERDAAYKLEEDAMQRAREAASEYAASINQSCVDGKPTQDVQAFLAERREEEEAERQALEAAAEAEAAQRLNAEIETREELQYARDELNALKKEEMADHERQRNLHVHSMENMFTSILSTERERHARQLQDEREQLDRRLNEARRRSIHRTQAIDGLAQELSSLRRDVDAMPPQDRGAGEKLQIWTVEIDRSSGDTLGFDLEDRPDDALDVASVAETGLVPSFNKKKPLQAIEEGDRILRVNGHAGALLMKDQLRQFQMQRIVLARQPDDAWDISKVLPTAPRNWTIQLNRLLGEALGMELGEGDDSRLRILSIETKGLVPAWNARAQVENPDQLVQIGDRILAVNGKQKVDEIKHELGQHTMLGITLSRTFGETIVRPVTIKEQEDEDDGAYVFTIEIDRNEGKPVGLEMFDNMEHAFQVEEILRDGLVFVWNKANRDRAVREGDLITAVNGRTGTHAIADELEHLQILEITVKRMPSDEDHHLDDDEDVPKDKHVNAVDKHGRTYLHRFARKEQDEKCMELLTNPNFTMFNAIDRKGNRALHYAAAAGLVEVVEVLCEKADYDVDEERNKDGKTATDLARENGHIALMRVIAAAGSNFHHDGW